MKTKSRKQAMHSDSVQRRAAKRRSQHKVYRRGKDTSLEWTYGMARNIVGLTLAADLLGMDVTTRRAA